MSTFDISLEEFRRRQFEHSSTPDEKRKRCPECGSVNVVRKSSGGTPREYDPDYTCGNCGDHFDNPAPPEVVR